MMCQYCNTRQAANRFVFHMMGEQREVHLCAECTELLKEYTGVLKRQFSAGDSPFAAYSPPTDTLKKEREGNVFSFQADADMRLRRHMNALRGRLKDAIDSERYEEAARLRDSISKAKKDVCAHES